MEIKVLVVEDDQQFGEMAKRYLEKAGYLADLCADGETALCMCYENAYHLVLLDIMLPGLDGYELLRELRKLRDTPVLMMTALGDDDSQLRAFRNEADDYLVKPCSMPILMAHADALLRRSGAISEQVRIGALCLYPGSLAVTYKGERIRLTPKEFEILTVLARNKNRVVSHERLLTSVWGYDFGGNEGVVHASMKRLRDKFPGSIIRNVKGMGYCLEAGHEE